ncbi:MAG: DUF5689 domain-containing protein [Bacteroidota bacterium]
MSKFFLFFGFTSLLLITSCVFEEFDEPPIRVLPGLEGNISIQELKDLHVIGTDGNAIPDGSVLEAVVIANDEGGNIFKELFVEDETGGILLRIDVAGLSALYPVGTPVAVRLDGLFVTSFAGKYQIASNADGERIPEGVTANTVLVNAERVDVTPTVLRIADLADEATFQRYISTLVQFDDIQFINSDAGVTYADVVNNESINRTLRDCFGNELVSRMSSFADFASQLTPTGNGSLVGVLSVFNDTRQITLRTPADFDFENERCGISVGGDLISISELRQQFSGTSTSVSPNTKIRGVVISDRTTNNINSQNLFLQDGNSGIAIRFDEEHEFDLGEELEISVGGAPLEEFRGLLQVGGFGGVPIGNASSQGNGTLPQPRLVDLSDVAADPETYEGTLILVEGVTLSGGSTLGDQDIQANDGTATVELFTFSSATFGGTALPSGEIDLVAIVSEFDDLQLVIRCLGDLSGGEPCGGTGAEEQISLSDVRAQFSGTTTSVPANRFIRGIVISDKDAGNITTRNLIIQDDSGSGIVVRFTANHNFALGEDIRIDVGGQELSEFRTVLQINNVPNDNAASFGPVTLPSPRMATVQEILDNGETWESTLVQINMATISGGSTFPEGGTLMVTDSGSGSLDMFTSSFADFAGDSVPTGSVTLTGYVSEFEGARQISMRSLSDIN